MPDICDLVRALRSHFFAKDRDVILQTGRVFSGCRSVPVGGIIMWSGAIVNIPTCWQLCDGTGGTPDLQDQFIVGAGTSYAVGATGGENTSNLTHLHADGTYATDNDTHGHADGTYAAANDTHNHGVGTLAVGGPSIIDGGQTASITPVSMATNVHVHTLSGNVSNDTHGHGITGNTANDTHNHDVTGNSANALGAAVENRPTYYALAYIQRVS